MCASEARVATDQPFAQVYAHSGMVGLDGEKMSKSKGNLVLVSKLREAGVDPMAIRLALLSQHYRDDWMWTDEILAAAVERLATWREAVRLDAGLNADATVAAVRAALADDLDAPAALAAVDAWAGASVAIDSDDTDAPSLVARAVDALLGVRLQEGDGNLRSHAVGVGVSRGVSYSRGARFRHLAVGRTLLPTSYTTRACTGVGVSPNRR